MYAFLAFLCLLTLIHGFSGSDVPSYESLLKKYSDKSPNLRASSVDSALSFLQTSVSMSKAVDGCDICVYVIQNKELHQPFLCRGLKEPSQQQTCVTVLVSLMWWLENQVYWVNYGCQRAADAGAWEWVKPCPAHAICSWIQNLYDRQPYCPADPNFRKPAA